MSVLTYLCSHIYAAYIMCVDLIFYTNIFILMYLCATCEKKFILVIIPQYYLMQTTNNAWRHKFIQYNVHSHFFYWEQFFSRKKEHYGRKKCCGGKCDSMSWRTAIIFDWFNCWFFTAFHSLIHFHSSIV